ncbi:hypothetical protein ABIE49_002554 [Bradyrhizobium sp. OAE829]
MSDSEWAPSMPYLVQHRLLRLKSFREVHPKIREF